MILQALTRLYEDLAEQGKIPLRGWTSQSVSFALCLNEEGKLLSVIPLFEEVQRGKKMVQVPLTKSLPAPNKKTSGVASQFLCENANYFLGVGKPDKEDKGGRGRQRFQKAAELHHQLLDDVEAPEAKAILRFFDSWEPDKAETVLPQDDLAAIVKGGNLIFSVNGVFAHEVREIRAAWQRHYESADGPRMQCLISGREDVIERIHPAIKKVRGAAPSGASLVSFNAPAFSSYGLEQSYNAPVGKYAAFAYTSALNFLLADWKNVHQIGDATVVTWAEGAEEQYVDTINYELFGDEPEEGVDIDTIRAAVKRLSEGKSCPELKLDPNHRFYILGLSPAKARLSVRFFYQDSFGALLQHISEHHHRMKIVKPSFDTREELSIYWLLQETVNEKSKDKTPSPILSASVARAILTGGSYPAALMEGVMLRIRAEHTITRGRAAIIKAYYMKNPNPDCPEEVLQVSLKENSTNTAYNLGRLFAVYEQLQQASVDGELKATIKDKYLNAAAAAPAYTFPVLDNLAQKHLRKLDTGIKIWYNNQIIAIKSAFGEEYPNRLTLPQQGSFNLGYYHQTQKFYEKKERS